MPVTPSTPTLQRTASAAPQSPSALQKPAQSQSTSHTAADGTFSSRSSAVHSQAPLSHGALACIIPFLPSNTLGSSAAALGDDSQTGRRPPRSPFVSAEGLFARAMQPPSATLSSTTSALSSQLSSAPPQQSTAASSASSAAAAAALAGGATAGWTITRPLALLAAGPRCRRAVEENFTGGCVLAPHGALVLQVRQRETSSRAPPAYYQLSPSSTTSSTAKVAKSKDKKKNGLTRHENHRKPHKRDCQRQSSVHDSMRLPAAAREAASACLQQLVVTSTNVAPPSGQPTPLFHPFSLSRSPARSPVQRPHSARLQTLASPALSSPRLLPARSVSPRQSPPSMRNASSPAWMTVAPSTSGPATGRDGSAARTPQGDAPANSLTPHATTGASVAAAGAAGPRTPPTTHASLSPVLRSRRVPVGALLMGAAAFPPLPPPVHPSAGVNESGTRQRTSAATTTATAAAAAGAGGGGNGVEATAGTSLTSTSLPSLRFPSPRAGTAESASTSTKQMNFPTNNNNNNNNNSNSSTEPYTHGIRRNNSDELGGGGSSSGKNNNGILESQRLSFTPPLRPIAFPSLSPRPLPSPTAVSPTALRNVRAQRTREDSGSDALTSHTPLVPPSLQALRHALWWLRRGPLPVSLSLLRYAETDVHALWALLRVDPEPATPPADEESSGKGSSDKDDNGEGTMTAGKRAADGAVAASGSANAEGGRGNDEETIAATTNVTFTRKAVPPTSAPPLPTFSAAPRPKSSTPSASSKAAMPVCASASAAVDADVNSDPRPSFRPALPSPVTELHVHGRAADAVVAALLPGHPEVRAVRLTHASLTSTQLRDIARYCPDVTHLSLAMNDRLRSTSFLCPTPSEASSSVATTATTTNTTATTATTIGVASGSLPGGAPSNSVMPPAAAAPAGRGGIGDRSPRATLVRRTSDDKSSAPPPRRSGASTATAATVATGSALFVEEGKTSPSSPFLESLTVNNRRGALPQPPALESSAEAVRQMPPVSHLSNSVEHATSNITTTTTPPFSVTVEDATCRKHDNSDGEAEDNHSSLNGEGQSTRSDLAEGTAHSHSRSTQAPSPRPHCTHPQDQLTPYQPQPPQQQHGQGQPQSCTATPRDELHNSQVDLFAAEEEGEAEMRFSLWQAAQTDAAERRQAVFILRPSDVVLGDAGEPERGRRGLRATTTAESKASAAHATNKRGGDLTTQQRHDDLPSAPVSASVLAALQGKPTAMRCNVPLNLTAMAEAASAGGDAAMLPLSPLSDDRPFVAEKNSVPQSNKKDEMRSTGGEVSRRDVREDVSEGYSEDDVASTLTTSGTETTATVMERRPPSVASTTQHTDPLRSTDGPPDAINATLAELTSALGKPVRLATLDDRTAKGKAAAALSRVTSTKTSDTRAFAASPVSPHEQHPSHAQRKRAHASLRRTPHRLSPHWSETLVDLDLSYTQILDDDAARDVPQLRALRRLSLEGCMQLSQVRWLPSLASLRELNLSFSSVHGTALYPLGDCTQLVWLKLEGCASLTRVSQLWEKPENGRLGKERTGVGQGPEVMTPPAAATPNRTTGLDSSSAPPASIGSAAVSAPAARVLRHHTAGGIPAITILPASASTSAPLAAVGEERREDGRGETQARFANETALATTLSVATTATTETSTNPRRYGLTEASEAGLFLPSHADGVDVFEAAAVGTSLPPLLSTLRVLIVTSTGLDDTGLLPLHHIVSLECVLLDRCPAITNVNVAAQLPSLHTLDASRTGVTAPGLSMLRQSRTLRQLRLQGCLALTSLPAFFVESSQSSRAAASTSCGDAAAKCTAPYTTAGSSGRRTTAGMNENDHRGGPQASHASAAGLRVLDVSLCSNLTAGGVSGLVVDTVTMKVHDASAATDGPQGRGTATTAAALPWGLGEVDHADFTGSAAPTSYAQALATPPLVLPQLRHLLLRSCDALAQLSVLCHFTHVVELDLYHTNIDDAALTTATAWWTCLEVLNIASTRVRSLAAWCPPEDAEGENEKENEEVREGADQRATNLRGPTTVQVDAIGASLDATSAPASAPFTAVSARALSRLPRFAATLRVLTLSNTDIISSGLRALRYFPQLEVVQLSNCRRLTSLSFLALHADRSERPEDSHVVAESKVSFVQLPRRTALRELTVTEAVDLRSSETFPYLAACPCLRTLSLAGCAQVGSGMHGTPPQPLAASSPVLVETTTTAAVGGSRRMSTGALPSLPSSSSSPPPSVEVAGPALLPPIAGTASATSAAKSCYETPRSVRGLAVLRCMGGLTELNLSRTAVTQDDLRALLKPPVMKSARASSPGAENAHAARAATRLNLLTHATPPPQSTTETISSVVSQREGFSAVKNSSRRVHNGAFGAGFAQQQQQQEQQAVYSQYETCAAASLQRLWLRGCRFLDEDAMLDAAAEAEAKSSEFNVAAAGERPSTLTSMREVYLSQGRFGPCVLRSL